MTVFELSWNLNSSGDVPTTLGVNNETGFVEGSSEACRPILGRGYVVTRSLLLARAFPVVVLVAPGVSWPEVPSDTRDSIDVLGNGEGTNTDAPMEASRRVISRATIFVVSALLKACFG